MTDQALEAVESDPLERMIAVLDEEEANPPDEESANEEAEAEPESAPEEEGEEQATKADEAEALEVIIHNGVEKQLTKAELKEYAQQGFDATQKWQAAAERQRFLDEREQHIQQQAQFTAQFTDQIAEAKAIQSQLKQYEAVDWQQWVEQIRHLSTEDPYQYQAEHAKYQAARLQYDSLKETHNTKLQTLNHLQQQAQQATAQQQAQLKAREAQAMRQAIPEWKDAARAQAEWSEIDAYLAKAGYEPGTLNAIMDHRQVVIARKAMAYDKLMASGKQKVASAPPPTAKPGSPAKPQNADASKHREALRKTGRGEHAAKLIEQML